MHISEYFQSEKKDSRLGNQYYAFRGRSVQTWVKAKFAEKPVAKKLQFKLFDFFMINPLVLGYTCMSTAHRHYDIIMRNAFLKESCHSLKGIILASGRNGLIIILLNNFFYSLCSRSRSKTTCHLLPLSLFKTKWGRKMMESQEGA